MEAHETSSEACHNVKAQHTSQSSSSISSTTMHSISSHLDPKDIQLKNVPVKSCYFRVAKKNTAVVTINEGKTSEDEGRTSKVEGAVTLSSDTQSTVTDATSTITNVRDSTECNVMESTDGVPNDSNMNVAKNENETISLAKRLKESLRHICVHISPNVYKHTLFLFEGLAEHVLIEL